MDKVITRIPPSPTGHLHIGTARTALFNYLFAKHYGGEMIFRSEDTDKERSTKEYEQEIIEGLRKLGIQWDNEEIYRQSERQEVYKKHILQALETGALYISKEESKREPGTEIEVVRLRNPNKKIVFEDLIRGEISFDTTELGDIVVARGIDDALYHLTVVVDDAEMGITHVLRGEDHISNTPRQILIQEAFGFTRPKYAHLPLILAPDRSKMSKRHGAVSVIEYLQQGILPEAIVNYLALLGWNSGTEKEIFTMEELIEDFSIEGIQKSGAVFDMQKLMWINKSHLDNLSDEEYQKLIKEAIPDKIKNFPSYNEDKLTKLIPTIRERVSTMSEVSSAAESGEYDFAFIDPEITLELIKWKNDDSVADCIPRLKKVSELLENTDFNSPENIKSALWNYAESEGKGEVLWPMRVALTGRERSPDPFTVASIIGKEYTQKRLKNAVIKLESEN